MRILHELNQLDRGGAERVVLDIVKNQKKLGIDNEHTIFTYHDGPMRRPLESVGATVIIDDPKKTPELQAEVIHIHTGGGKSILAESVKGQIPTIETVHSPVVSVIRPEYVTQRVGVSDVVSKMNRNCITIHNGVDIDRLNMSGPMFALSGYEIQEGFIPFEIVSKITDVDELNRILKTGEPIYKSAREFYGIPEDSFVVGRLGRIGYDKYVEEFLIACKKTQDSNLVKNMHVIIAGSEASNAKCYLAKIKVAVDSLKLRNVHFIPDIEEVGWAYEAMDVFLYPSPNEGFGLVCAEAMACGVPVVTWETPLTRELFYGASILADNTIESLRKNLIYLALNSGIRKGIGSEGKEHILANFTAEKMAGEYADIYTKVSKMF